MVPRPHWAALPRSILFNTLVHPAAYYHLYYPTSPPLPFRMAVLTDFNDLSARSLSSRLTPNDTQRITLIVAGCYIIIIGILWYALSLLLSLLSITELPVNESLQACAIFELYQCVVTSPVFPLSLTVVLMRITVYQFIRSSECSRM